MDDIRRPAQNSENIYSADTLEKEQLLAAVRGEWEVPCPRSWFEFDTWKISDALLLFAGIRPEEANIEWQHKVEFLTGVVRYCIAFIDGMLIGQMKFDGRWWYWNVSRLELEKSALKFLNELSPEEKNIVTAPFRDEEKDYELSKAAQRYLWADSRKAFYFKAGQRLNLLHKMWISRLDADQEFNPEKRYPKEYYIDWIENKNLQKHVPWWKSAIKHGFVTDAGQAPLFCTDQEIHPRKETTYLTIIGALLEITLGQIESESLKNQTQLTDFIVEKYGEFPGISKRTLDEKFSAAKKELKKF